MWRPGDTLVTQPGFEEALRSLGLRPGMTVLVHSSLSSLGWVCGGPVAVILGLESVLGDEGTLVMPSQSTDLSEPSKWKNPAVPEEWWREIRETMPAFDPDLTPTRQMGTIAETFRKQNGTVRSNHPAVSFAARGKLAAWLMEPHDPQAGLGPRSPLGRMYEIGSHVLLLGVGHARNTSLHLAEYLSSWPSKRLSVYGNPVRGPEGRRWLTYEDLDHDDADFEEIGEAFERSGRKLARGTVGKADAVLMEQRELVDFAVEWMTANRS